MAENKKGFVLYADQKNIFNKLSNEEAGILIKHIFKYVNDENPECEDRFIDMAFEPIKMQLKRDLKKYEAIKVKRSEAGKISAENKKQQNSTKSTSVESVKQTSTKSTVNDNVTVTVNDTDNVILFKEKKSLVEVFLTDLPNSSNFETITTDLKTTKEKLILMIPAFYKTKSMTYKDFNGFCDHFKRWAAKNLLVDTATKVILKGVPKR